MICLFWARNIGTHALCLQVINPLHLICELNVAPNDIYSTKRVPIILAMFRFIETEFIGVKSCQKSRTVWIICRIELPSNIDGTKSSWIGCRSRKHHQPINNASDFSHRRGIVWQSMLSPQVLHTFFSSLNIYGNMSEGSTVFTQIRTSLSRSLSLFRHDNSHLMLNAEMLHIYYCQFLLLAFLKNRKLKCHNRRLHSSANIEFYNLIVYFGHFVAVANWIKRIGLYANCARLPRGAYNLFANRSPRQTCKLVCGENGNVNGTGERTDFDLVSRCRNWTHTALFTFHLTQSLHKLHRFEETPVCCRRNIRYIARALPYIFAENQHVDWSREFIWMRSNSRDQRLFRV